MFTDHLNHYYLIIKTKLNGKEARQIEELTAFNFTIIYYKKAKNPINGLSRQSDFKDNNELSTTKHQLLPNFLSKFQKHLKDTKSDPIEEQNIDFDKTLLFENVLNLTGIPQNINSTKMLPIKSENTKNDPIEK